MSHAGHKSTLFDHFLCFDACIEGADATER